ncbi:hypothetical protein GOHSU_14_01050 [Gordonia hirsuta DSM 44140 = NBRC 16056]|uniref:DUF2516 family protein n=1 Tax=Gordonia hirsuta DSM 44140 = NBRC 16056 TaxID=1121927 RepID=L7LA77_9ACTN|nr:hypothetical protein GOHSU_14_01050 [Gordonia hirsuta DSM 44140 = NBRC 16056]
MGLIVNLIIFCLMLVITVLALLGGLAGLVHAIATRPDAFPAVDARSKGFWIGILAVSTLVAGLLGVLRLLSLPVVASGAVLTSFSGLLFLAAVVGISVYLAEVRPRVDDIQGRSWFRNAA